MSTSINGTTGIDVSAVSSSAITADRTSTDGTIVDLQKDGTTVGSIGTASSTAYIAGDSSGIRLGSTAFMPATTAGANKDAQVDLGVSSARWKDLYLSGGVYLGGTGSENLLQDYETGSFTPTVNNGTLTFNRAAYTKIGNTVHLWIANLSLSNYTDTSTLQIESLPFAASAASGYSAVGSVMCSHRDNSIAIMPYMSSGADYIRFYENSDTGSFFPFSNASLVSSASNGMYLSITYQSGS